MRAFADSTAKIHFFLDKNKYKRTKRGSRVIKKEKIILKRQKRAKMKKETYKEIH